MRDDPPSLNFLPAVIGVAIGGGGAADDDAPVVVQIQRYVGIERADDERIDLGVDLHAPADRAIDRGGGLDRLDLIHRREVLAAQLRGEGDAVEPGVGHLVRGPVREPAELLRLVAGSDELVLDRSDPVDDRHLVELRHPRLELVSNHRPSTSAVA